MRVMKIHILTALWKRPEITRICFEGIKRLGLSATVAISEKEMIPLCDEYGIDYVITPNRPVGYKWNEGMIQALKHEWDYVMILGSDDIVSDSLLDLYKPYMGKYYMFGVDSCYFYYKGAIKKFTGYADSLNMSVGAGRMIHRSLVEDCMPLWSNIDRGLDGNSLRLIRSKGYDEVVVPLGDSVVLDIKSNENLNAFDNLQGEIVSNDILSEFSEIERNLLSKL